MSRTEAGHIVSRLIKAHGRDIFAGPSRDQDVQTSVDAMEKEVLYYRTSSRELKKKVKELVRINRTLADQIQGGTILSNVSLVTV